MSNLVRESRAMTLFERIEVWRCSGKPRSQASQSPMIGALVDRWQKIIAGEDRAAFEARLGWDDLGVDDVVEALSWVSENPDTAASMDPGSGWSGDLETMFRTGLSLSGDGWARRMQEWARDEGIPFVELWSPWLVETAAEIRRHHVVSAGLVSEGGMDDLLRHLLRQISDLASHAAFTQFDRWRSAEVSALDDRSGSRFFREWSRPQIDAALEPLFDEYPVLARQLHRLLTTWKHATIELLDRVGSDRSEFEARFFDGRTLGAVVEVLSGLSDRHHEGRRVAILVFESGAKIVYKPRPLALEAAFADFSTWLVGQGLAPEPTLPVILEKTGYGWMEHLGEIEFGDPDEVSNWFTAAGALLCVAHVLRASDLHFDNVLVGEASPVLIDLETMMHPELTTIHDLHGGTTAADRVAGWMRSSFQSTGMLTFLQQGPDGAVIDIGGLCGTGGHELAEHATRWEGVGGDDLRKVRCPSYAKRRHNIPVQGSGPTSIRDHLGGLQSGFAAAYRLIMGRRSDLVEDDAVMSGFYRARSRVLLRPTEQYARVLQLSFSLACQRDGATVGLVVEALNRGLIQAGPRPANWDVVAWERRDLELLDIPRWTVPVEASVFEAPDGQPIEGVIAASGRAAFKERVRRMSEEDLSRQLHLMALSLESPRGFDEHAETTVGGDESTTENKLQGGVAQEALMNQARGIADELVSRAVQGEDQSLIWLDPVHLRPSGRTDRGNSYYLYSGSVGIAIFLAAMQKTTPGAGYGTAAEGALRPILDLLESPNVDTLLAAEGLGACHGLGGIVYGLTLVADFLDESTYLEAARRMAGQITPKRIAADGAYDVEGGAAGAILGLLALHDRTADRGVLETARSCGRALIERQQPGTAGGAGWPARQGGMLAGFAHGACGNALALVRLWRKTGDPDFIEAGRRAIDFENTLYDPWTRNWPLSLEDTEGRQKESRNMVAWCHGAPGIALARACVRDVLPGAEAMDSLNVAIDTTLKTVVAGPDHLCCGNLGRVDVLLTVGSVLGRAELRAEAETRAAMVIRLAANRGSYRLGSDGGQARAGFFRGLAGVGYQMLRLSSPDKTPSVLALHSIEGSEEVG